MILVREGQHIENNRLYSPIPRPGAQHVPGVLGLVQKAEGTGENVNKNIDCGFHGMEWAGQGPQAWDWLV